MPFSFRARSCSRFGAAFSTAAKRCAASPPPSAAEIAKHRAAAGIAAAHNSSLHRQQPVRIKPVLTPDPVKPRVALLAADPPDNATASNHDEPASRRPGVLLLRRKS
ncbi:hypothetical protein CEJ86_08040 [Sinorhizobium meliloti]|uniref:Uncharacterized protein n=1 Tax=Rhizobium meliloti TaxID=382 RepID=A0A2J0Z533_RHIML|nr:hypothetical protein CEJ86_08040 [Sinorhizobium meliloti]